MQTKNTFILTLIWSLFFITSCNDTPKVSQKLAEVKYNPKVAAFTSGMVSNQAEIMVRFSDNVPSAEAGNTASSSVMKISPSVKGEFYWLDKQSLVFKPSEKLKQATVYKVKVDLGQVFTDAKDDFEFSFQTITQNYRVEFGNVTPYDNSNLTDNKLTGTLILSDFADTTKVYKILSATQENENLEVEWLNVDKQNHYEFILHHIRRKDSESKVKIELNGKPINVDKEYTRKVSIPGINDFDLMDAKEVFLPSQAIEITFTDPLNSSQNLDGLISWDSPVGFSTSIENNLIKVTPHHSITGSVKLMVNEGIENVLGVKTDESENFVLTFTSLKPQVEFIGEGTILPESEGLNIPFKAVSLKEVQVHVIKIFENNVASFLQVNKLDGAYQLKRAGRLVLKKTIPLNTDRTINLNKWNTFSLKLDDLIKVDRGALYRIEIQFSRRNAIYPCAGEDNVEDEDLAMTRMK